MAVKKSTKKQRDAAYEYTRGIIERSTEQGKTKVDLSPHANGGKTTFLTRIPDDVKWPEKLAILELDNTQVGDLSPINSISGLACLFFNNTPVSDLSTISNMSGLEYLHFGGTQVSDLGPISTLSGLIGLDLDNTPVNDLTPIRSLGELISLTVDDTMVDDLNVISNFQEMRNEENKAHPLLGVSFARSVAAKSDPRLKEISEINDDWERTQALLDYLDEQQALKPPSREDIAELKVELDATRKILATERKAAASLKNEIGKLGKAHSDTKKKIDGLASETEQAMQGHIEDFDKKVTAASEAFSEGLATEEPVKLWAAKETEHKTRSDRAYNFFVGGLCAVALLVCIALYNVIYAEDALLLVFSPPGCDPAVPGTCGGFSFRGLVVSGGILTLFTLLLWFTRLQMKLYLAERHLRLDARERQAFAQTYLGFLKEESATGEVNEQKTAVYAALFRPTSDGIVKEDGGLDPSLVAAISKFLTKA